MGKKNIIAGLCVCAMSVSLIGCGTGNAVNGEEDTTKNLVAVTTTEAVDLSGVHPDAAREIQVTLDTIDKNVSVNDKTGSINVIKQSTGIMALAVGNSLVENQVELVIKDWKQRKSDEDMSNFKKKFDIVYSEYNKLNSSEAESELKKAGLSLADYNYCGIGKLDMVEWINNCLK